jgi:hypothetical protein
MCNMANGVALIGLSKRMKWQLTTRADPTHTQWDTGIRYLRNTACYIEGVGVGCIAHVMGIAEALI